MLSPHCCGLIDVLTAVLGFGVVVGGGDDGRGDGCDGWDDSCNDGDGCDGNDAGVADAAVVAIVTLLAPRM